MRGTPGHRPNICVLGAVDPVRLLANNRGGPVNSVQQRVHDFRLDTRPYS